MKSRFRVKFETEEGNKKKFNFLRKLGRGEHFFRNPSKFSRTLFNRVFFKKEKVFENKEKSVEKVKRFSKKGL